MQDLKNGSNEDENPKQTADAAPAAVADRYRRDDFVAHLGAGVTVGMIAAAGDRFRHRVRRHTAAGALDRHHRQHRGGAARLLITLATLTVLAPGGSFSKKERTPS